MSYKRCLSQPKKKRKLLSCNGSTINHCKTGMNQLFIEKLITDILNIDLNPIDFIEFI